MLPSKVRRALACLFTVSSLVFVFSLSAAAQSTGGRILGRVAQRQGNTATASTLLEASLADFHALGFRWWVAWTLADLGHLAIKRGDLGGARRWLAESLILTRQLADQSGTEWALEGIARLAAMER